MLKALGSLPVTQTKQNKTCASVCVCTAAGSGRGQFGVEAEGSGTSYCCTGHFAPGLPASVPPLETKQDKARVP
jgi:hypothetical protein